MTKALLLFSIQVIGLLCPENAWVASNPEGAETTIRVSLVAYDLGVEQANGSCRQTVIARREKSARLNESDRHIIIRHQSTCLKLIPEQSLKLGRQFSLKLKRDTNCDQTLEDLQYFIDFSPNGTITKSPRLRTVPGRRLEEISTGVKLPCYQLVLDGISQTGRGPADTISERGVLPESQETKTSKPKSVPPPIPSPSPSPTPLEQPPLGHRERTFDEVIN
jgi:hypothetical protein